MGEIKQKYIIFADLNPTRGHEQKGKRPVIVISGDGYNKSGMLIICPTTTKLKNYYGNILLEPDSLNGLEKKSEILISQIRTISQNRIIKKIGEITQKELEQILYGLDALFDR